MNLLLDTHTLLWALFEPGKISRSAAQKIKAQENDVSVSVISFWEISLKYALGKLELFHVNPDELPNYTEQMGIDILPLNPSEAASFHNLPRLSHKDPFDRLIIWQAIERKMSLITSDRELKAYQKYGLRIYW